MRRAGSCNRSLQYLDGSLVPPDVLNQVSEVHRPGVKAAKPPKITPEIADSDERVRPCPSVSDTLDGTTRSVCVRAPLIGGATHSHSVPASMSDSPPSVPDTLLGTPEGGAP